MRSIRFRLILGTAGVTALIFAISGVLLQQSLEHSLVHEFDDALTAQARGLAAMAELKGSRLTMEYDPLQMPEYRAIKRAQYFQLWSEDGQSVAKSPSLADGELMQPKETGSTGAFIRLPDGRQGRILTIHFQPSAQEGEAASSQIPSAVIAVARDTESLNQTLARFAWLIVAVYGTAIVASSCLLAWVIRSGLGPLGTLAGQIGSVGDSDLSRRIELSNSPVELFPVVQRLNELLERLDAAFTRERSFSSDIAHELRTPLAGLRTTLQVCAGRKRSSDEYAQTVFRCLDITKQLDGMVDTLLMLARAESHQLELTRDCVRISEFVNECWQPFSQRAAERDLTIKWAVDSRIELRTDRDKLRLVLQNLFDNAVCYTNIGGAIRIESVATDEHVKLIVANSGSHVSQEQTVWVFDRLWRGDVARADTGTHCGLGLTLCKRIIEVLGGSITVSSEMGGLFSVEIRLHA